MTRATRFTRRSVAIIVLAVLGATTFAVAGASATAFQVWSCTDRMSGNAKYDAQFWFATSGNVENHCPDGLELYSGNDIGENVGYGFTWVWTNSLTDSAVSRVTFTMKGGDTTGGLVYEIAPDLDLSKPAIATLPSRAPGEPDLTVSVKLPPGTGTLGVRAVCTINPCTGTSRLRFNEIKLNMDDSTPPSASISTNPQFNFDASGATDGTVPWFRKDSLPIGIGLSDGGTGLSGAALKLDNALGNVWSDQNNCATPAQFPNDTPPAIAYESPQICTGNLKPPSLLDLRGVSEGRHKLTLSATDALGLSSAPVVGWFGVDSTPPLAPTGFNFSQVAINSHGWTTDTQFAAYLADSPPSQGPNASPIDGGADAMITRDDASGPPKKFSPTGTMVGFPSEGHFRVESWYTDAAGNHGYSTPIFIGLDTTRSPAPVLDENGWVSRKQLIDGYSQTWQHLVAPSDVESGICGFLAAFDGDSKHALTGTETINGNVDSAQVPANLAEGHSFSHVASVSCAGRVSDTSDTPLPVDATDPQVAIKGLSRDEWSRGPLHLTIEASDELSGVDSVDWSVDGGSNHTAPFVGAVDIGDGQHVLTTSALDRAGNQSASSSTVIRVDSTGPISWLGPAPGGRPNEFESHVEDPTSGLDSGALQFRRIDPDATAGEKVWRQAGAAYIPAGSPLSNHSFTRSLDDSALADGQYELRVVAVDRAGNVGYGSTLPAGGTVTVNLPLRQRPVEALAVNDMNRLCTSKSKRGCVGESRCRRGAHCTFKWVTSAKGAGIDRIVNWGDRVALTGNVLTPGGAPMAGIRVSIFSTPHAGEREFAATVTTDGDGKFEWRIPDGPTRRFAAVTTATDRLAAAETTATLAVRAGVDFRIADRSVRSGQKVRFSGRLLSRSIGVPAGGKLIQFQFWRDGKWNNGPGSTQTDGSGRYHWHWNVQGISSRGTLFIRAAAITFPESAWPFESGKSAPIGVAERP